ncbi:uncharacterized protein NFIA_044520 [Aspergillus fischeri NRRL 181]|uniref:Uncharacterized protein n=1 Tax=Neosartorya fischeri (strain ATCC 1020 / DSM 3700 / CBS 544.65 / FGSC A1164 / JCM 1740 / NRRL 181 / WB 181) TaxID=331117 RepID=A1CV56_NEOFI|nr:conserved hypothetical protein [Aspergillus fischeri NRRL 181]EAW25633.1 conserved hypothetical protein [Aspergillus fischeri NRRL 181]KAG2001605.1 hypothetical protein GB937_010048 [Aspergillus fischeri]
MPTQQNQTQISAITRVKVNMNMNMNTNMHFLSESSNPPLSDPPPPYTPAASPKMPESQPEADTKQPLPPSATVSPTRGIQIPSKHDYFTSGFAYPPFLATYDISPHHWTQFTDDLNEEVKLSPRQWATTVAKGVGVLALGGMMAGVLGAIPAVLVARKARRNREEMNLIIAASERPDDIDADSGSEGGSRLSRKVKTWNETFFQPRGIMVRVVLPWEELDEMQGMEVLPAGRYGKKDEQAVREDASRKARIVIIPVDTDSAANP